VAGYVVSASDVVETASAGDETTRVRLTIGPDQGCERLEQRVIRFAPGRSAERHAGERQEVLYVASGRGTLELDGERHELPARHAVFIPMNVRHRLRNEGDEQAVVVFTAAPLAPRPPMGHVDTEQRQPAAAPAS
jgi:putative monooxygenase